MSGTQIPTRGDERPSVRLKRVYAPAAASDGFRVLVDRLWPRGLTKQEARVDLWLKAVAPSSGLRRWYHADLLRWGEFRRRYKLELCRAETPSNAALNELREIVRAHCERGGQGVTLVFGAKDEERNHAIVLLQVLLGSARSS